jgi:oligopeptidase B
LGRVRFDPFQWLKFIPERGTRTLASLPTPLRAHLEAERRYADAILAPLEEERRRFERAMLRRLPSRLDVPGLQDGDWIYAVRQPDTGAHSVYLRRPATGRRGDMVLLDERKRAVGSSYYRTTAHQHSPDHRYFIWAEDVTGNDRHRIVLHDTATVTDRVLVPADAYGYDAVVFSPNSRYVLWVWRDAANRPRRVYRTDVASAESELVYEEPDPAVFISLARTAANDFVVINLLGREATEVRLIAAGDQTFVPRTLAARRRNVQYSVDEWRGRLVMLTNGGGAIDNEVREVALDDARTSRVLVPVSQGRTILSIHPFENALARVVRHDGSLQLILRSADGLERTIAFDEDVFALEVPGGQDYASPTLRVVFQTPRSPRRWIDVDLRSGTTKVVAREPVPGLRSEDYVVERMFAMANDGELVPITLLAKRTSRRDGTAPLLLYGYGAYGVSSEAEFSIPALALVDQGWSYAIAHVRGGSEKGPAWFEGGRAVRKRNSFTDFIACAEHLCANGVTLPGRIVSHGVSAGGLLVAGAMNLAPSLFAGVIAKVPFVDMLNTMSDASHPLVPLFRPDWGDPLADPVAYDAVAEISPYENVRAADYPAVLCTAGLKDDRVGYWEPAKLVAQIRARSTGSKPAVLKLDVESGHQTTAGEASRLAEMAIFWAFALGAVRAAR